MTRALVLLVLTVAVTSTVYMPVCDLVFDCGCTWSFLGGVAHCNIHNPTPPHCPICEGGVLIQAAFFLAIAGPLFLLGWGAWARLAARLPR